MARVIVGKRQVWVLLLQKKTIVRRKEGREKGACRDGERASTNNGGSEGCEEMPSLPRGGRGIIYDQQGGSANATAHFLQVLLEIARTGAVRG